MKDTTEGTKSQIGGFYNMPMLPVQVVSKAKKAAARKKSQSTQLRSVSGGSPPPKKEGPPEPAKHLKSVGNMKRKQNG